jgi:hypothetical protein
MAGAEALGQAVLELFDLRTEDELTVVENAADRLEQLWAARST